MEISSQPPASQQLHASSIEARLLELFAPSSRTASMGDEKHAGLWRSDAIHRAKNMAQMTMALADVAGHPSRRWLPPEVTKQARGLSRAYEELGVDDAAKTPVPCSRLLMEVATRLANIFGRSRQVTMVIFAEAILLSPEVRRLLVLIASELVINALKYGYPAEAGGTIMVSLAARTDEVELIVEDDGVGVVETSSTGHGGVLLEQLTVVLGATMTRTTGVKGHGFRISTLVPIKVSQGDNA